MIVMMKGDDVFMRGFGGFCYALCAWFVGCGFYKLFVYNNGDFGDAKNYIVGGDAYNYIINSGQATAYFVMALLCFVVGISCYLYDKISDIKYRLNAGITINKEDR